MDSKHTPGPWKYHLNVGPTKALIFEADGSTIVELANRTCDSRFEANVRLIAAAPDLLAALKLAYLRLDQVQPGHGTRANDLRDYLLPPLRAAIAKAEGR